jgi:hypothetical protein
MLENSCVAELNMYKICGTMILPAFAAYHSPTFYNVSGGKHVEIQYHNGLVL